MIQWRQITQIHTRSAMQRLQHRLRVGFRDAEEGAGGAFGASVALFPVLEGAGADAHEGGKLILAESEFLANRLCIGRRRRWEERVEPYLCTAR